MFKRIFATNSCFPNRLVFADKPAASDSEKTSELTLDNLRDTLTSLEGEGLGKLKQKTVSKALRLLRDGSAAQQQQLLELAKKFIAGDYDDEDFEARMPSSKAGEKTTETVAEKPAGQEGENEKESAAPSGVSPIRADIRKQIADVMASIQKDLLKPGTPENEKMRARMQKMSDDLAQLDKTSKLQDAEYSKKLRAYLDPLVGSGKLTTAAAEEIVQLSFSPFGKNRFDALTAKLDKGKDKLAVDGISKLKEEQYKNDQPIISATKKLIDDLNADIAKIGTEILEQKQKEKIVAGLTADTGVAVKPGQELKYDFTYTNKEGKEVTEKQIARIKKIEFISPETPIIYVESKNPETGDLVEDAQTANAFCDFVDNANATENISTREELEKSIDQKLQKDQKLEFAVYDDPNDENKFRIVNATITAIDEAKGEISLDQPVSLRSKDAPRTTFSFAEFAKWYKHREVVKRIGTLEELRSALAAHHEFLNTRDQREPKHYPPIEVVPNEMLKYDDTSGATFVIKDVGDNEINFTNGDKHTFASFLRWVKKNEPVKMTPQSEAARETETGNDAEKAQAEKEKEAEMAEAHKNHRDPNKTKSLAHSSDESMPSVSSLRVLWNNTKLLSVNSIGEMFKTIKELVKRKLKNWQESAVGTVGERLFHPFNIQLADEFRSRQKHAENEEVEYHYKHNSTLGVEAVREDVHHAQTKEILLAAIKVLCDKGQMRWDDPEFHHCLNHLIPKYGLKYDDKGKPIWIKAGDNLEDSIKAYLDGWFGEDKFRDLRNKNDSSYNGIKSSFEDHAKRLEADSEKNGGLKGALQRLMYQHMRGEYVNPAQYEKYLHFAIERGKLDFEDKIFFLLMAFGAPGKGGKGQTLLHIDRLGALEGDLVNAFPTFAYFVSDGHIQVDENGNPIPDENGQPTKGKPTANIFRNWIRKYIEPSTGSIYKLAHADLKFDHRITDFVTKDMVWNDSFQTRVEKASTKADRWDHDDMHMLSAFLSETQIEQLYRYQGGATMNVSIPGLRNALVGFNNFVKIKHEMLEDHLKQGDGAAVQKDLKNITNLLGVFTKFDAVLSGRAEPGQIGFVRLSAQDLAKNAGVDGSRAVRVHIQELHNYIAKLAKEVDQKTGNQFGLTSKWSLISKTSDKPADQNIAVKDFRNLLESAFSKIPQKELADLMLSIQNSGGEKMVGGIKAAKRKDERKGEVEQDPNAFISTYDRQIKAKVEELQAVQMRLVAGPGKTAAQIKIENDARIQKILDAAASGRYDGGPTDLSLLNNEILRLQAAEEKQKAANNGEAANENGNKKKKDAA